MLRPIDVHEFDIFYSILDESFPVNERRSYKNQLALLENDNYSILADSEEIKGILAVWDFIGFRYIEHFAVKLKHRNLAVGEKMLNEYINKSQAPIVLEVEPLGNTNSDRRIGFYKRMGFKLNPFDYIQPAIEKGRNPVPLCIMTYPCEISEADFVLIRNTLYKNVYNISLE